MSERPKTVVTIVDYAPVRLGELADLWVESWAKTLPAIDFEVRRPWFLDHIAGLATAGAAIRLAITPDGRATGFVTVDAATAYLDQICVGVAWWGGGVADTLLAEARRLSPVRLVLDVNKDNPRAVAFYERNGFRRIAEGINPRSGLGTLKLEWTA